MPKFKVTVEKKLYCSGVVEVTAKDWEKAQYKVNDMIATGELQTTDIDWDDGQYEDFSFRTTGDVE